MNRLIYFIIISFILNSITAARVDKIQSTTDVNLMHYATIDVLVVLYSNTSKIKMSEQDIMRLKNGIELSREFIWRNSACQLNLSLTYLQIDEFKEDSFFPEDGLLFPEFVEQDFEDNGIESQQYGIIVLVYSPPKGGGNYGGMTIFENTGYSFFRFPCKSSVRYPGEDPNIDYLATWLFTHEIQHSIDLVCYEKSGASEMWHGDKPLDFSIDAGEQFSYQAEIFRNFKSYLSIRSPWGRIAQAKDMDGDGFPDRDDRVPMDEYRFGSDSTKSDTDVEGLSDLAEFMAGIYQSSDPNNTDTDGDGLNDKNDPFPLHLIHHEVPKLTPQLDDWSTWYPLSSNLNYSSQNFLMGKPLNSIIFMAWDDDYLYFGCEIDAPADVHFDLDLLNDGWWHGRDNYGLVIDPFSERFNIIRVMDTSKKVRDYRKSLGNGNYEMWDDDPKYISKFGKILVESSILLQTEVLVDKYRIKMKIPNNKRIPFELSEDKKIGMRIYFTSPDLEISNSWATLYEQYEFFDIKLK